MELSYIQKLALNGATFVAWLLGIIISVVAVTKGNKMKQEMGVSFKVYLSLVAITEIVYTVGALMILSAMGVNVMGILARMEIWKFYKIISTFDISTIKIIGIIGWIGFIINRTISFLSPGYLLVYGWKKLPKYFFVSAWSEVALETLTTIMIFFTLGFGK